jgi:hypothetical protein
MATWEDGPEYAPVERPRQFEYPDVAPLSTAAPFQQLAALAPKDRPLFADPSAPVAPLATLHPMVEAPRDPQAPFDVASSTMTSQSAWGALHWNPPSGSGSGSWGSPSSTPWPVPEQPMVLSTPPVSGHGGMPAPGTPAWFGPGAPERAPDTRELGARAVFAAATPGLCICLLIGGLVYLIAPVMLLVSFGLARRVWVSGKKVRTAFGVGLGLFGLLAILGSSTSEPGFSAWWANVGVWALVICWGLLAATLAIVRHGLVTNDVDRRPANPNPWG